MPKNRKIPWIDLPPQNPGSPILVSTGGGSVVIHNNLRGREARDAHPMSSISNLDDTIAGLNAGINGRLRWRGQWIAGQYEPNDVVEDENWLMVANTVTEERAAPQPAGGTAWLLPESPVWESVAASGVTQIHVGNQISFTYSGIVNAYRFYLESSNPSLEYRVVFKNVTTPDSPVYKSTETFSTDKTGWIVVNIDSSVVLNGDTWEAYLLVRDPVGQTVTVGNWDYNTPNNMGVPASGEIIHPRKNKELIRISTYDNAGNDLDLALSSLGPGDEIADSSLAWSILNVIEGSAVLGYYEFEVEPAAQSALGDGVRQFTLTNYKTADLPYSQIRDYWLTHSSPYYSGVGVYYDGYSEINTYHGYPIDIQFTPYDRSQDWDFMSYGGFGGGSGSGGGQHSLTDPAYHILPANAVDYDLLGAKGGVPAMLTPTMDSQTSPSEILRTSAAGKLWLAELHDYGSLTVDGVGTFGDSVNVSGNIAVGGYVKTDGGSLRIDANGAGADAGVVDWTQADVMMWRAAFDEATDGWSLRYRDDVLGEGALELDTLKNANTWYKWRFRDTVTFDGGITFSGPVSMQSTLDVAGNVTFQSDLDVTGQVDANNLRITTDAIIGGIGPITPGLALEVKGPSKLAAPLEIDGWWNFTDQGEMRSQGTPWSYLGKGTLIGQDRIQTEFLDLRFGRMVVGVMEVNSVSINPSGEEWVPGAGSMVDQDVVITPERPMFFSDLEPHKLTWDWRDGVVEAAWYYDAFTMTPIESGSSVPAYYEKDSPDYEFPWGKSTHFYRTWQDNDAIWFRGFPFPATGSVSIWWQKQVTDSGVLIDTENGNLKISIAKAADGLSEELTIQAANCTPIVYSIPGYRVDTGAINGLTPPERWDVIHITWDATNGVVAYVNGAQVGSASYVSVDQAIGWISIGGNSNDDYFNGWLAHFTLWDRELTAGEIAVAGAGYGSVRFGYFDVPVKDHKFGHAAQYELGERVQIGGMIERTLPDSGNPFGLSDRWNFAFDLIGPLTVAVNPFRMYGTVVGVRDDLTHFTYTIAPDILLDIQSPFTLLEGCGVAGYKRATSNKPQGLMLVDATGGAYAPFQAAAVIRGKPWDPEYRFAAGNLGGFAVGRYGEFGTGMAVDLNDPTKPYIVVSDERLDISDPTMRLRRIDDDGVSRTVLAMGSQGINLFAPIQVGSVIDDDSWWADDIVNPFGYVHPSWSAISWGGSPDNAGDQAYASIYAAAFGVPSQIAPERTAIEMVSGGGTDQNMARIRSIMRSPTASQDEEAMIELISTPTHSIATITASLQTSISAYRIVLSAPTIYLPQLPTSTADLPAGALWNNNGVVSIA